MSFLIYINIYFPVHTLLARVNNRATFSLTHRCLGCSKVTSCTKEVRLEVVHQWGQHHEGPDGMEYKLRFKGYLGTWLRLIVYTT